MKTAAPARAERRFLADWGRRAMLPAVLVLACGCTSFQDYLRNGFKVGPNYQPPHPQTSANWIDAADPRLRSHNEDLSRWWMVFDDPQLHSLIQTALEQNLDLKTAAMRVLDAKAQRNVQVGNLFPQSQTAVGLGAHLQIPETLGLPLSNTFNLWTTGFNASWELDFWGRLRRAVESANGSLGASIEDFNNVRVTLLAEVATSYIQLRTFQQRFALVQKNVKIQRGVLTIAGERFKNGATTNLDVQQARANLAQTESLLPPLRVGIRQANNQLCILLGLPPQDLTSQLGLVRIPTAPKEAAVGIPADLLRRRPDIRQAEREVAAQSARIGMAEADLYPRFLLLGYIGYAANSFDALFSDKSLLGLAAPAFQWNILNYGRVINSMRSQQAKFEARALQYQQTVLRAQREAEDAQPRLCRGGGPCRRPGSTHRRSGQRRAQPGRSLSRSRRRLERTAGCLALAGATRVERQSSPFFSRNSVDGRDAGVSNVLGKIDIDAVLGVLPLVADGFLVMERKMSDEPFIVRHGNSADAERIAVV